MLATWQVMLAGALASIAIAAWVRRAHGARPALVTALMAAISLACLWVAYEVLPVERWRRESLAVGLAIFALPALAGLLVAVRRNGRPTGPATAYLIALWATPALLLFISQRRPFGSDLADLLWWAACSIAIYVAVPVGYAAFARQSVRGYGLSLAFARSEAVLVTLIAPIAFVIVWLASADQRFLDTYPFYKGDGWSLLVFEVAYGASFVALEFFFRGFLVFAGQPVLGVYAVPVMAFAYCLLHLGKPLPEAVSSLVGGLVLGYLALRLTSIFAGVVAHLTIAWGMDGAVLRRSSS